MCFNPPFSSRHTFPKLHLLSQQLLPFHLGDWHRNNGDTAKLQRFHCPPLSGKRWTKWHLEGRSEAPKKSSSSRLQSRTKRQHAKGHAVLTGQVFCRYDFSWSPSFQDPSLPENLPSARRLFMPKPASKLQSPLSNMIKRKIMPQLTTPKGKT